MVICTARLFKEVHSTTGERFLRLLPMVQGFWCSSHWNSRPPTLLIIRVFSLRGRSSRAATAICTAQHPGAGHSQAAQPSGSRRTEPDSVGSILFSALPRVMVVNL